MPQHRIEGFGPNQLVVCMHGCPGAPAGQPAPAGQQAAALQSHSESPAPVSSRWTALSKVPVVYTRLASGCAAAAMMRAMSSVGTPLTPETTCRGSSTCTGTIPRVLTVKM